MRKKIQEEIIRKIQPFLIPTPKNTLVAPTLAEIKNNNDNLKHVDDNTLARMFNLDHDSIQSRIEGAKREFDVLFNEMTEEAKLEMLHDYPEIREVMMALYEYSRSPKTSDNVKSLYNMTRYFSLTNRILEYETPHEIQLKIDKLKSNERPDLENRLTSAYSVFYELEVRMQKKLESDKKMEEELFLKQKMEDDKIFEEKLAEEKAFEKKKALEKREEEMRKYKNHPYYIPPIMKYTPYN